MLRAIAAVPIGCYIDEINALPLKIMDRVLAPEEQKLFIDKSPDEQRELFYTLWNSLKTAIKSKVMTNAHTTNFSS